MKRHTVGDDTFRILNSGARPKEEDLVEAETWRNRALNRTSSHTPSTGTRRVSSQETDSAEPPKAKKYRSSLPASYYSHNGRFRGYDDSPFDDGYSNRGRNGGRADASTTSTSRETEMELLQSVKRAKSQLRQGSPFPPAARDLSRRGTNGSSHHRSRQELDPVDEFGPDQELGRESVPGSELETYRASAVDQYQEPFLVDGGEVFGQQVVVSPIHSPLADTDGVTYENLEQIDALSAQIANLNKTIEALRQTDEDERVRYQQLVDSLSRAYSQKASDKVREMQRYYTHKLQEASDIVAQERREKADLVRACDAFFSSLGERKTY